MLKEVIVIIIYEKCDDSYMKTFELVSRKRNKTQTTDWKIYRTWLLLCMYIKNKYFGIKSMSNCNYLPLSNTSDEGKYNIKNTRLIPEAILTLRQISIVKYNFMVSKMSTTLSILSLFQIYKTSLTELSFAAHKHCYQLVSGVGFQMISMWLTIKKKIKKNHNG